MIAQRKWTVQNGWKFRWSISPFHPYCDIRDNIMRPLPTDVSNMPMQHEIYASLWNRKHELIYKFILNGNKRNIIKNFKRHKQKVIRFSISCKVSRACITVAVHFAS